MSFTLPDSGGGLGSSLQRLDALSTGADFILGHNRTAYDLPQLESAAPGLLMLQLPAVDTLGLNLNPLALPRNPYNHLVKHRQDGELGR